MYACEEHIDYVLEDFIDQYQVPPSMEKVIGHEAHCAWCNREAHYELRREEEGSLAD